MVNNKNSKEEIDNDNTEVVISGIRKSRTLMGKVSDITSMFMKKKQAVPPPPINSRPELLNNSNSTNLSVNQDLPTRIAHPLDRSTQMEKMELSNKGHNFQKTDVKIESEQLHSIPEAKPKRPILPKVNSGPPIQRSESYTNVDFNLKREMEEFEDNPRTQGLLAKLFSIFKKKDDLHNSQRIQASENTQVFGRDETVIMAAPVVKGTRRNIRLAMAVSSIIILLFISRDIWVKYKKREEEKMIKTPELIDSTGGSISSNGMDLDTVSDLNPKKNNDQIVNFQSLGRGMAFNCQTKSWHCLDAPNFRKCRTQMRSDKKGCVTKAVLESVSMCQDELKKQAKSAPSGCR